MPRNSGFTLIELIAVMALAAILLAVGVPAFRGFLQDQRIIAQTNGLVGALNLARSEAIKRGVRVVICRTAGADCATDATGIWEGGWTIYTDNNGNGARDAGESIIWVGQQADGEITIRTGGNFTRWIGYQPGGSSVGNTNLGNGTFRICDGRGADRARFVAINTAGRARIREKRAGDVCP
jgi:type IV fimbrial biogenesis protein FimT